MLEPARQKGAYCCPLISSAQVVEKCQVPQLFSILLHMLTVTHMHLHSYTKKQTNISVFEKALYLRKKWIKYPSERGKEFIFGGKTSVFHTIYYNTPVT